MHDDADSQLVLKCLKRTNTNSRMPALSPFSDSGSATPNTPVLSFAVRSAPRGGHVPPSAPA